MKSLFLTLTVLTVAALTAQAQWFGGYASYWDTKDFGETYGGGFVTHWQVHERIAIEGRGVWFRDTDGPEGDNPDHDHEGHHH
ncbi:MAG: hypothetical protein O3A51_02840 [Verrucomicrobia bacterium]|nr:hypothetical protein [Verrucomicrobiota bacterium]